jgi:hypothetical protein
MPSFQLIFLGCVALLPSLSNAQAKCPWINEATARGILDGPVTATVKLNDHGAGSCEFSRHQGASLYKLLISVASMSDVSKQFPAYLAQCAPHSEPLRTIGNEAVSCAMRAKNGEYIDRVVGRVREQAFIVTLGSSLKDDACMPPALRRDKAHLAAEQVAGILF